MNDNILEINSENKHLSIFRGFVRIEENSKKQAEIDIESLLSVVVSAKAVTFSKNFFVKMAENNIPVIICGENYHPLSYSLPLTSHYRMLEVAEAQLQVPQVLKKNLWQKIVKQKITNQAKVLDTFKLNSQVFDKMTILAERIFSHDKDNKEAQAAKLYFPALFGTGFIRDIEQVGVNSALNYGYSILRASIARAICASGMLPFWGIKHSNKYNAFCLADDLMEVLRPAIDYIVYKNKEEFNQELNPKNKRILLEVLNFPFAINENTYDLTSVSVQISQSLARSYRAKKDLLELPRILITN